MHERERSVERGLAREADSVGTMECYLALEDALSCACGRQRPHGGHPFGLASEAALHGCVPS